MNNIADIRKDYKQRSLGEADVAENPFAQFTNWWEEAVASQIDEVNAMTLATATVDGKPSARIVLLKGFDENGFVFFTNYNSHKGKEIAANPFGSLVFFWKELERQVRVEGRISMIPAGDSDLYFNSRPVGSRIGALASPQSSVIPSREIIEEKVKELERTFQSKTIERPEHWGGYILKPDIVEFWQGRPGRLHDRIQYTAEGGGWRIDRLAP
ncbi:MAG: pyridoxamine 5'-phosphate oxidase [Sphingobacteriales bacterium]|nr:MAG: pyridoxamine 5'-phosphate oxidase [Sphingobacteriales bacterium]